MLAFSRVSYVQNNMKILDSRPTNIELWSINYAFVSEILDSRMQRFQFLIFIESTHCMFTNVKTRYYNTSGASSKTDKPTGKKRIYDVV